MILPTVYPAGETGKATKGAAVALLMKVLMYQAKPGVPSEKWREMKRMGDYFIKGEPMTCGEMTGRN